MAQSGCHIKHLIVGFDPTSPISLIWDESTIPSTKLADFPLQPNANGRVFGWRGSAEWPLLVYDPGHTGVITSPHQLFGNWTFGGKRVASLGASTGNKNQSAWENGYEALEILDADRDGKVSGEELAPLGLWFDRNRDGVSQPGEVQSLKDLEVTELFYKSSATDPVTGDIYASNGFTRIVDGKPVLGRSVDWYARSYNSKVEAALSIKTNVAPEASAPAETQQVSRVNLSREALLKTGENLLGVWRWRSHTADKNGNFPEGLVVFEELDGPSLRGYTLVEMQLKEKPGYLAKSMVTLSRLHGSLLKTSDEEIHIEFTVTASDGHITRTRATLDIALKTLKGESKSRRSDNGKINPSTFEVDYSWTAKELRHDTK